MKELSNPFVTTPPLEGRGAVVHWFIRSSANTAERADGVIATLKGSVTGKKRA